jgi:hypothetical protein
MENISFSNAFCEIAQFLYGEEEGMQISFQFEKHSSDIIGNIDLDHFSPCYDFYKIARIIEYIDFHMMFEKISIFLLPFPYRPNIGLIKKELKDIWHLRRLFYSGNGRASLVSNFESLSKNVTYELIMSITILDPLIYRENINEPLYNHKEFSSPYKCEIDRVYNEFRIKYGTDYRHIDQKGFLDFVNQKITTKIADHDLKCIWRAFYVGKIDISFSDNDPENKKD